MYFIVEFEQDNEVALVPENWLSEDETSVMWPSYRNSMRINSAAAKKEPPNDTWSSVPIKMVLYRDNAYQKVRAKLRLAEEESDLETDENPAEIKRKRRAPKWISSDSSDDEPWPVTKSARRQIETSQTRNEGSLTLLVTPPPRQPLSQGTSIISNPTTPTFRSPTVTPRAQTIPVSSPTIDSAGVRQILTLLESIKEEQREGFRRLMPLLISRVPLDESGPQLPEGVSFTIRNSNEMDSIESILEESDKFSSVVRYLAMFGGSTVRDTINRILREVFGSELAQSYNFEGKKGKLTFRHLKISAGLFKCIQRKRNPSTRAATRKDVEVEVRKWLAGARDRDGGRKRRSNGQQAPQEPDLS